MKSKKLNLIIIGTLSFPYGFGEENRLIHYTRGIIEHNHCIKLYNLFPSEKRKKKIVNVNKKGVYNGIPFEYTSSSTIMPHNKIVLLLSKLAGLLVSVYRVVSDTMKHKPDAFIMATRDPLVIFTYFIISRALGIPMVHEAGEFPYLRPVRNYIARINKFLFINVAMKLFDGIFSPSKALVNYFQEKCPHTTTALVTMMIDPEKFTNPKKISITEPYIAYCGSLQDKIDGLTILIEAFSIVVKRFPDIKLYLIGDPINWNELSIYHKLVREKNLGHKVIFTGMITYEELPGYLCGAKALLLARRTSIQGIGGFPGKLGEYLSTGNPVVITKVGEITDYLSDGKTAFLAEPDNVNDFARRICDVLNDPLKAKEVGKNGRDLVYSVFHYKVQSKELLNLIFLLKKRKHV